MADKIVNGKIIQAVYTTEELSQEPLCNIVIDEGLVVYEKCDNGQIKMKLGNGVDIWNNLNYLTQDGEIVIFDDGSHKDVKTLTTLGSLPYESIDGSSIVVVNNELHMLGGILNSYDEDYNYHSERLSHHYKYINGTWIEDVNLPYQISHSHCASLNDELHIFGGSTFDDETETELLHDYHYKLTNGEWIEVSTLPVANGNYSSLSIVYNNEIHYMTSIYDEDYNRLNKHYVFNGTEWTELCDLPEEIDEFVCCGVIFGMLCLLSCYNDIMYGYDDANNCWREMFDVYSPHMSTGQLFNYNQDIYLFTGYYECLYKLNTDYEFEFVEELEDTYVSTVYDNSIMLIGCTENHDYDNNSSTYSYNHYMYRKHYTVTLEDMKKNSIIKINNSFPITSNLQVIENGYKVIEDGNVKIGVYFNYSEMTDINEILNSKAEIDDDKRWSETTTYSAYKINELLDEKPEIDDDYSSNYSTYSSNKIEDLLKRKLNTNEIDDYINLDELDVSKVIIDQQEQLNIDGINVKSDLPYDFKQHSNLPHEGFVYGSAISHNNIINILGGNYVRFERSIGIFNEVSKWTNSDIKLPYAFKEGSAVVYNDEIHILGGDISTKSSAGGYATINYKRHYKFDGFTWTSVGTLPYEFEEGSAVVYNNEIHILGSRSSSNCKKHYKFNGSEWIEVSTLPYDFYDGNSVVYNNEIHILGGYNNSNSTSHYKWNGSEWTEVSTLPYESKYSTVIIYNNEIHLLGGTTDGFKDSHYKWNGSEWAEVCKLPHGFCYSKSIIYNNEMYLLGGNVNPYDFYKFNGASWDNVGTLPFRFYNGCSVVYNDNIYILGGNATDSSIQQKHYKYINDKWIENEISIPYEFKYGSAVVYKNNIHILGGEDSQRKHYKFNGSEWIEVSTLPYNFCDGDAVIYNNEIHIFSGNRSSYYKNHYKFDGFTWTYVSTLPFEFNNGAAVVLDNELHILDSKKHYKFNGSEWIEVSTLPKSLSGKTACIFNNKIHIIYHDKLYRFDNGNWIEIFKLEPSLHDSFYNGSCLVNDNRIHILYDESHFSYGKDLSDLSNVEIECIKLKNNNVIPIKQKPTVLYVDEDDRLYIESELTTSITASELFSLYTKGCLVYLSNYEKYFKPISFSPYGYLDIYTSEGIKSLYTSDAEF